MSDLIKKKDVLALVKSYIEASAERMENDGYYEAQFEGFEELQDDLFNLETFPSADRPQEWIPCSERLPDLNENGVSDMVLLCWSDGQMTVGAYQGGRTFVGQAWPTARDCRVTVTAWQPLPKPWKGADDE